jgi:multidrug resistance efflux pump
MVYKNNKLYIAVTAALAVAFFTAGCPDYASGFFSYLFHGGGGAASMPYELSIYKAPQKDYDIILSARGRLECINELSISAPDGIWGARIEKLAAEGGVVNSGEVICSLNTSSIEETLNRAMNELSNSENELEDFKLENELEDMSKKVEITKKDLQYEVSLFKLGEIKKGADTIEVAISNTGIEKNLSFIKNFETKLKSQKELLKKGFLSSFQFAELELDYQRNILELEQNYNKLEMLKELPLAEEVKKNETTVIKLEFDRKLTAREYQTASGLNTIEEEKKELNINEKKHKVAQAQSMIDKAQLKAPIGGTLLYSVSWIGKTRIGMEVWSGLDILKIVDLQNMKVIVKINEKYIDNFKEGATAVIMPDSQPGKKLKGFVHSISKLARLKDERDPKGPKEFDVTIYFKETSEVKLVPNMSAGVDIICSSLKNSARVPKDFADKNIFRIVSPVNKNIDIKKMLKTDTESVASAGVTATAEIAAAKKLPEPLSAAGGELIMAGEDEDYFYFTNCPNELSVLIPQKGTDTVENNI